MDSIDSNLPAGDRHSAGPALAPVAALDENAGAVEPDFRRQRMAVRVGPLGLLMPWDGGREVTPAPPASRIPNTAAWLRGLANVRGSLIPVVDTAVALGVVPVASGANFLLICGHGETSMGLLIDGLPRAFDIGMATPLADPDTVPAMLKASVIARYGHDDRIWMDLDLESLFNALTGNVGLA